jgi:hypothetical protein
MTDTGDKPPVRVPPEKNRGGEWVTLGDEQYRIPPLAFRAVQELAEEVDGLRNMGTRPTAAQMATVSKIVHEAMKRNYPSMPITQVDDMLDIGNYQRVLGAVLQIGGFKREAGGEGAGEIQASTGTQLTAP